MLKLIAFKIIALKVDAKHTYAALEVDGSTASSEMWDNESRSECGSNTTNGDSEQQLNAGLLGDTQNVDSSYQQRSTNTSTEASFPFRSCSVLTVSVHGLLTV